MEKNIIVPVSEFDSVLDFELKSPEKQVVPQDKSLEKKFLLHDMMIYVIIVIGGGLLCVVIIILARRMYSGTKLKNLKPEITTQEKQVYIPKLLLSYGTEDLKTKPISVRNVVIKIEDILANKISTDNVGLYKIAREYKLLQSKAIERLDKCLALADLGKKREALMMMSTYPSLIDIINELQFSQLEKWTIYCARAGAPVPDRIPNDRIDKINEIISEIRNAPEDHSQLLRKYMASNEFEKAIELLEMDLAISPKDTVIARRLLSVKNNFLDAQITRISTLAQNGKHSEAVALFDSFQANIPQELKDASPRWQKMFTYIRSQKFNVAQKELSELKADLETVKGDDWRKIFVILSTIDGYLDAFPELKNEIDEAVIAQKRAIAENQKCEHDKQEEFENSCNNLNKCVETLYSLCRKSKISRAVFVDYISILDKAWNDISEFGKDIPVDVSERYKNSVKFINSEIKRIDTRKKITILSISTVILLTIGTLGTKCYLNKLRNEAYAEYYMLCNKNDTAKNLEDVFLSVNQKYTTYATIPQFVEIKAKITKKINTEKKREEDLNIFVIQCKKTIELKPQSNVVKKREIAINNTYDRLSKTLPSVFDEELNEAKEVFDIALKKYKVYIEDFILAERAKAMAELRKQYSMYITQFSQGNNDLELVKKINDIIGDFKKLTDKYVKDPSKSDSNEVDKIDAEVKKNQKIMAKLNNDLERLSKCRNFSTYSIVVKEIIDLCKQNKMEESDVYKSLNGTSEQIKSHKKYCENIYRSQSSIFHSLSSGLKDYFIKDELQKGESKKEKNQSDAQENEFQNDALAFNCFVPENSEDNEERFIYDFAKLCSENDRNMYSYKREWYTENSGYKPFKTDVVYTVGTIDEFSSPLNEIGEKFRGCDVLEATKTTYSYYPVSESLTVKGLSKLMKKEFKHIIYADSAGTVDFGQGVKLSDGVLTPESKILSKIHESCLIGRNGGYIISPKVSFLDTLNKIVYDGEIRENFKLYVLGTMLDSFHKYIPYGTGFYFSPTAVRLNTLFRKDNKAFLSRGSWAFGETENRIKAIELFPTRSLEECMEFFTKNKMSFTDEAKLTARCVMYMQDPEVKIIGIYDKNGNIPSSMNFDADKLYISRDSHDNIECKTVNDFKSVHGRSFAPIVEMMSPQEMVTCIARQNGQNTSSLVESVYSYLFNFDPNNKLERKTMDKNVSVSKKLGSIIIPKIKIQNPGIPLSEFLRSIESLSQEYDKADGSNTMGVKIEFKSDWDLPITFRADYWNVGRILAFICNKYDFSLKISNGKVLIEKKSLRYEN